VDDDVVDGAAGDDLFDHALQLGAIARAGTLAPVDVLAFDHRTQLAGLASQASRWALIE